MKNINGDWKTKRKDRNMSKKRSLFDMIFGKRKPKKQVSLKPYFALLNGYNPIYVSKDEGIYELGLARRCIDALATEYSKATPSIVSRTDKPYARISYILQKKPNPFMTPMQFMYRLSTIYLVENNAYIVPIEDDYGKIIGLYPILPSMTELKEDDNGTLYVVYSFFDGNQKAIEYSRIGHLRRMQYKHDFFGTENSAFRNTADLVRAQEKGSADAIKSGSTIRYMGKLNQQIIDDEDFKEQQQSVARLNLNGNDTGLFIYDSRWEEMKQVTSTPVLLDAEQKKAIDNSVYTYFGVNEDFLQNKYSEDVWNAIYESNIEPFLIQCGEILTGMFFSEYQMLEGNEIMLSSDRLQYASNQTKIQVAKEFFDRGLMTTNQALSILNLPPVKDGDKRYIRSEYINIEDVGGRKGVEEVDEVTGTDNGNSANSDTERESV